MRSHLYILKGHDPVPCESLLEWGRFFERPDSRRVAETTIGALWVSTVFLGMDHGHFGEPILFETMVFARSSSGEIHDHMTRRYCTWEEAEAGHAEIVAELTAAQTKLGELQRVNVQLDDEEGEK